MNREREDMDIKEVLERLKEIEARADKVTEGVWKVRAYGVGNGGMVYAQVLRDTWEPLPFQICDFATPDNAEFIAHAREDIPWLCKTIRELLQQQADLEEKYLRLLGTIIATRRDETDSEKFGQEKLEQAIRLLRYWERIATAAHLVIHRWIDARECDHKDITVELMRALETLYDVFREGTSHDRVD